MSFNILYEIAWGEHIKLQRTHKGECIYHISLDIYLEEKVEPAAVGGGK